MNPPARRATKDKTENLGSHLRVVIEQGLRRRVLTYAAGLYRDTLVGDITEARDTAAAVSQSPHLA